jgi:hypothetical protein
MKSLFKYASLLAAAVMLLSCEKENTGQNEGGDTPGTGVFELVADKDVIQSNGTDASTLTVYLDGVDVTAESVIYNDAKEVVTLTDGKFTASADGEYKFWASYGTYTTFDKSQDDSGMITVRAISVAIPEVAEDPDSKKTSFVHRAFLTQYRGTGCGYCPYMIKIIRELMADNTIPGKAVLAAVHSYSNADPAYISAPRVSNYPYMHINLDKGFSHTQGSAPLYAEVNSIAASDAKAGISVNPVLYEDGTLVLKVSVKAAVDGEYRVGAWLLEDGIYGQQSDYDGVGDNSFNTHENCVRSIESRYDGEWAGKDLGAIKAGQTAEKTFVMDVKLTGAKAWKVENLHLAMIVSSKEGSRYVVCNAIDCPIDAPTPFDYK